MTHKIIRPLIVTLILSIASFLSANQPELYLSLVGRESQFECNSKLVTWSEADVKVLPTDLQCYTRYFSLADIAREERLRYTRILSGHLNHLSRHKFIAVPEIVPNTELSLVRINILNYRWSSELWERLADIEPFYHVTAVPIQEGVTYPSDWMADSKGTKWRYASPSRVDVYGKESYDIHVDKVRTNAPWLAPNKEIQAKLANLTYLTQSKVPIVKASWFIYQTSVQAGRKVGYFDFLDVKDRDAFEQLIGFNAKLHKESHRVEIQEAVSDSGISQEARGLAVFSAFGGGYWKTLDNIRAVDKNNPLRVFDANFEHVAEELIGPLPNGCRGYFLSDNKGKRQDSAPDFIGYNQHTKSKDGRIHAYKACLECHNNAIALGSAGLIDFSPWARNIFRVFPPSGYDAATLQDIKDKYLSNLAVQITYDRLVYDAAVREATGLSSDVWGMLMCKAYADYERPVDFARMAKDVCLEPIELSHIIRTKFYRDKGLDLVISGVSVGQKIPISTYEELFPVLMLTITEYREKR